MNMTIEMAERVIAQALNEFIDPNALKVIIVNGPRAELRGVPEAQVNAIAEAWNVISEALANRNGPNPIAMGRRAVRA
ncbi:MAG: hypothetical protein JSU86_08510 [Phycisphaerales bacterium]|nr:MAG: hypothetical protein JSU86_08510 [Phycisphaerales bacterium]